MKFHHKAFVRWDDLDAFGHVNNAKYLVYAQEARFEWGYQQFAEKKADSALDRKSTRLNSSHVSESRMPSSA